MTDVGHHAHYFLCGLVGDEKLSNRILPWPQPASHCFVDDDDGFIRQAVARHKIAPGHNRNSHGFEIAVADDAHESLWIFVRFIDLPLDRDAPGSIAAERQRVSE